MITQIYSTSSLIRHRYYSNEFDEYMILNNLLYTRKTAAFAGGKQKKLGHVRWR